MVGARRREEERKRGREEGKMIIGQSCRAPLGQER